MPLYVAAPVSTFDPQLRDGARIPIEERAATEVTSLCGAPIAAPGAGAPNPAFDVTPAAFVRGLVTDRGLLAPPFDAAIKATFAPGR